MCVLEFGLQFSFYGKHATEASEGMSDVDKGFAFPKASRFLIRTSS